MPKQDKPVTVRNFSPSHLVCLLVLSWGLVPAIFAQEQQRFFRDEFDAQSPNLVESASNVVIDRVRGEVRLAFFDSTVSTPRDYQINLEAKARFFKGQVTARTVVDVDLLPKQAPSDPDLYIVTDAGGGSIPASVFLYDPSDSTTKVLIDLGALNIVPLDAFSYRENSNVKILVVGIDTGNLAGRVIKFGLKDVQTKPNTDWEYRAQSPALQLDRPSDAFVFENPAETSHPNQVIICDTGNDRLIAVDTTVANDSGIRVLQGTGLAAFGRPVDLEGVPAERDVFLVTDQGSNRVVLVQRSGNNLVYQWHFGSDLGLPDSSRNGLSAPADADAVRNSAGTILIADAGNNRVIEVDRQKNVVFCYGKTTDKYCFGSELFGLTDVDRLPGRRTIASFKERNLPAENTVPRTFAYATQTVLTEVFSFNNRAVDFDSLLWSGLDGVNGGLFDSTRIRLQMRSSRIRSDFQLSAVDFPFFGPDSVTNFYDLRRSVINRRHDGDSLFQFLVHLETLNPQHTPVLTGITTKGRFFRSRVGQIVSVPFGGSRDSVVTDWVSLNFPNRGASLTIELLDAADNNRLIAAFTENNNNVTSLTTLVPALRGKQSLRLRATLRTSESFLSNTTPVLEQWRVVYKIIANAKSATAFTNNRYAAVGTFRLDGALKDSVFVSVTDPSMIQFINQRPTVPVMIKSTLTEDTVVVNLSLNPTNVANFRGGLPVAFKPSRTSNDTLEVKDRDVLLVKYIDPIDNTDTSADTAGIIRRTSAQIRIESLAGREIDSIFVDNFFQVRVLGEKDQDLSPTKRDTIQARAYVDGPNREEEKLTLIETGDTTGIFLSFPIFVQKDRSADSDRRLRVFNNDDVVAEYIDPDNGEKVIDAIKAFGGDDSGPDIFTNALFDFIIAPNPYRASKHSALKLAARVQNGKTLALEQVEVFNLAGEKVSTIPGAQILFDGDPTVVYKFDGERASGWWSRVNDAGSEVASGTYFVKFHVRITDNASQRVDRSTLIRKLVLVQ